MKVTVLFGLTLITISCFIFAKTRIAIKYEYFEIISGNFKKNLLNRARELGNGDYTEDEFEKILIAEIKIPLNRKLQKTNWGLIKTDEFPYIMWVIDKVIMGRFYLLTILLCYNIFLYSETYKFRITQNNQIKTELILPETK